MSDYDDDIGKFLETEKDDLRPIDTSSKAALPSKESVLPPGGEYRKAVSPEAAKHMFENEKNIIHKGDYVDLQKKDQTLRRMLLGVGWDQKAIEEDPIDMDLSVFLLDKKDVTRVDEDFVFYNNHVTLDGAVKHTGDSRTGAGDGDDEQVFIDLNGLPFDILRVMLVLSIHNEERKNRHFGMIRNLYLRIMNEEDRNEIVRLNIDETDIIEGDAVYIGVLIREGPKWYFEALVKPVKGGLAHVASKYGILVKELQSTANVNKE